MYTHQSPDNLHGSSNVAVAHRQEPGIIGKKIAVPIDQITAGHPTNLPRSDSPESLDEALSRGTNREDIDPQHSLIRPSVSSLDRDENGAD